MASFRDLLAQTKAEITEVDTAEADRRRQQPGTVVLDVREPDEYDQGALPGALHIPRGHLESQIEGRVLDHDAPVVIYCAGGVRSAFAAKTLHELGYTDVVSMAGGFGRWKDEGREWKTPVTLTADQRNRYQRHLLLPEVGVEGQAKLLESKVLLLGAGGLGSPAALYLAAAGVGTIGIVDMDEVDESNLQRQILHNLDRIGDRKVDSAKKTLTAMNPDVDVVTYDTRLSADNVMELLAGYDVVIDGADNFPSRYLLNDASVKLGIPVVHGSIFRFEGMVTVFDPRRGPNYRDMVPEPPPAELAPSCAEAGVLGVLPGIIGSLQALEAIKLLLGPGRSADRPHPQLRRAGADLPRVQAAGGPHQPGDLREPGQDPDPGAGRPVRPLDRRSLTGPQVPGGLDEGGGAGADEAGGGADEPGGLPRSVVGVVGVVVPDVVPGPPPPRCPAARWSGARWSRRRCPSWWWSDRSRPRVASWWAAAAADPRRRPEPDEVGLRSVVHDGWRAVWPVSTAGAPPRARAMVPARACWPTEVRCSPSPWMAPSSAVELGVPLDQLDAVPGPPSPSRAAMSRRTAFIRSRPFSNS